MDRSSGVSPRIGQVSLQRFSLHQQGRCAYKLPLSAATYAQMLTQTFGSAVGVVVGTGLSHSSCIIRR